MRKTFGLALLGVVLYGCASVAGKHVEAPSLGGITSGIARVSAHISSSSSDITTAQQMIAQAEKKEPQLVPAFSLLNSPLADAQKENQLGQAEIAELKLDLTEKQNEVNKVTAQSNKYSDEAATDDLKLAKQSKLILELFIALGVAGLAIIIYVILKLRGLIPF